jgi:aspartate-semialdehyde dehydrogenase
MEEYFKVRFESRKILGLPNLKVAVDLCLRSCNYNVLSFQYTAIFETEVTREAAQELLKSLCRYRTLMIPENGIWPTPADVVNTDPTWVG